MSIFHIMTPPTSSPRDTLGRPLHDLRISVMDRCNFRCPYCMPRDTFNDAYRFLRPSERLSFEEISRLTRLFAASGVRKIRLTGGEPLLRPNLSELVSELTSIRGIEDVALTTNGILLEQQAAELKASGLRRITVSLDSLDRQVFSAMNGGFRGIEQVLAGIRAAADVELSPIKINCVVQRGVNDHTLFDLVDHFRDTGIIVRFIEYMDVGTRNHWSQEQVVPSRELLERIHERWPLRAIDENYRGEVAERYAFSDGGGEIGFISSVTNPFCGDCSRARLSSEGVLYTCLFASKGLDLRAPMRAGSSDDELGDMIRSTWLRRGDRYSEQRSIGVPREQKIEMHYIGG